jgi:hypothetical protein
MQSSYQGDETFLSQLGEHTYYLVPLVFDAVMPRYELSRISTKLLGLQFDIPQFGRLLCMSTHAPIQDMTSPGANDCMHWEGPSVDGQALNFLHSGTWTGRLALTRRRGWLIGCSASTTSCPS